MPAIRPDAISNLIRLAYETRAEIARLVAERRAVDTLLAGVIVEVSPDPEGIGVLRAQDELLAGTDELPLPPAIGVPSAAVMPFVECEAGNVALLGEPPERFTFHALLILFRKRV